MPTIVLEEDQFYIVFDKDNRYWFGFDFIQILDNGDHYNVVLFQNENPIATGSIPYETFITFDGWMDILANHPEIIHKE